MEGSGQRNICENLCTCPVPGSKNEKDKFKRTYTRQQVRAVDIMFVNHNLLITFDQHHFVSSFDHRAI